MRNLHSDSDCSLLTLALKNFNSSSARKAGELAGWILQVGLPAQVGVQ